MNLLHYQNQVKMRIGSAEKVLIEIKKGVVIGVLLTVFYGIVIYIYKNQNKNNLETKIEKKESLQNNEKAKENVTGTLDIEEQKNKNYEILNGYEYKKMSENEKTTFVKRSLGYEKRFSKTASPEELEDGLKEEYCAAIKEIKKVDQKIVPGTNISFKKATYIQVNDAYKEYLQKIAQIRQVVRSIIQDNKEAFEYHIKCEYKGTNWNNANSKYLTRDFYSKEVSDYYKKLN